MNDIQKIVDDFLRAAERLERLTVQINVAADQLEPLLRGVGEVEDNGYGNPAFHGVGAAAPFEVPTAPVVGEVPDDFVPEPEPRMTWPDAQTDAFLGRDVPQTPQGPAPSSASPPASYPGAVEVEGDGVGSAAAPGPAANPFETAPAAEPKKKGRRTHEQLADDAGVRLEDVKAWLGEGVKVTKAGIEEYAAQRKSERDAEAASIAASRPVTTPPDGSHLPTNASDPFGQVPAPVTQNAAPVTQQAAPVTPPAPPVTQNNPFETSADAGQDPWQMGADGQPTPVAAPQPSTGAGQYVAETQMDYSPQYQTAVPPTPDNPFGQAPAGEQPITNWSPFQ